MNTLRKNNIITGIILVLFLFNSCSENFLEPEVLSFYTADNVLVDQEGLQSILDNALEQLRDEMCTDQSPFLTNLKYSDVDVDGSTDKSTPWQDLNKQMLPDGENYSNAYTKIGWYWDDAYEIIKDCNTIISRIDNAEFDSEESKNTLLGSAYFLRAYRYYYMTLQFGDVPFVLEEITEPKVDFYTTTKESIWPKMIEDLEFSVEYVPEATEVSRGQVTKAACRHLLAKYYLLEGNFDDAIEQTSDIIDGGIHNLMTERFGVDKDNEDKDVIWDLFRVDNKSIAENTEGLFLTIDRYLEEGNTTGVKTMRNVVPNYGQTGQIKTPNGANGMTDQAGAEIGLVETYGRGVARIRPTYYTQHKVWQLDGEEDWTDYRHRKENGNWLTMEMLVYNNPSLKTNENPWYGENLQLYSDEGTLLCLDTIRCWFEWPHYKVWVEDYEQVQPQGGQGDWYVFRLAETYLLRAEAYVWKGEWQKAADDINIIRQRANATYMYTATDIQELAMDAILDERNRELYLEEPRKVELTRIAIIYASTGITCYNGKTYSTDQLVSDNFWYDRVDEVSDFYNKGVSTNYGNEFTCSPFHIFWPIPSYAIEANTAGVINQNEGYPGTEKNVTPLVYEGD